MSQKKSGPSALTNHVHLTATFNNAGGSIDGISFVGITVHSIRLDFSAAYTLGSGAGNAQTLKLNNDGAITLDAANVSDQLVTAALIVGTDGSTRTFSFTNNTVARNLTFAGSVTGSAGAGIRTTPTAATHWSSATTSLFRTACWTPRAREHWPFPPGANHQLSAGFRA